MFSARVLGRHKGSLKVSSNMANSRHTAVQSKLAVRRRLIAGLQFATGVGFAAVLAICAIAFTKMAALSVVSPVVLAFCFGTAVRQFVVPTVGIERGIFFASKGLLRCAIALLGIQLTFSELIALGPAALIICAIVLVATFTFTNWLGAVLKVDRNLSELLAAGTSVCGASAILAMNSVTRAAQSDVAYALASVTFFGTASIFLFPIAASALGLPQTQFGLWAGASIHEVAQVTAAAAQVGQEATVTATLAKLARVLLLAPLVTIVGLKRSSATVSNFAAIPWFVVAFVIFAMVGSAVGISAETKHTVAYIVGFAFAMALAALGLLTDLRPIAARGWRPFGLAGLSSVFIWVISIALIAMAARFEMI